MKLKSTIAWSQTGNTTNETGFSALPGGYISHVGAFADKIGIYGYWWTSTVSNDKNSLFTMYFKDGKVSAVNSVKGDGLSVRCIKD